MKKLTIEEVCEYVKSNGDDILSEVYVDSLTKLKFKCGADGHIFWMVWRNYKNRHKCPECSRLKKSKPIEEIINYTKYRGYKLISKVYINNYTKLKFQCTRGHTFWMTWVKFQNNMGCSKCTRLEKRATIIEEIKRYVGDNKDELTSKVYINNKIKLKFKCGIGGHTFWMTWGNYKCGHRCPECNRLEYKKRFIGGNNNYWKGGVTKLRIALFDTYASRLDWIEEVRRDPENNDYLQVKCIESNCKKWFTPTIDMISSRIKSINTNIGSNRFYCSDGCKNKCSIFNQQKYPKGQKPYYTRPDQNDWAKLVKERDNYECQRCGSTENLVAHHIEGLNINPIESADIDIGITFCKICHKKAHKDEGCRPIDLQKRNLC